MKTNQQLKDAIASITSEQRKAETLHGEIIESLAKLRDGSEGAKAEIQSLANCQGALYALQIALDSLRMEGTLEALQRRLLTRLLSGDVLRTRRNVGFCLAAETALRAAESLSEAKREKVAFANQAEGGN